MTLPHRMHRFAFSLTLLSLLTAHAFPQTSATTRTHDEARLASAPRGSSLLFQPFIAAPVEPRMGSIISADEKRLRLDIGNSVDLAVFRPESMPALQWAVGADFFTWTALRRDVHFHFPVDAVDYLFGVNASFRHQTSDDVVLGARLRLSHISAHLVDGSYSKADAAWRDARLPRVYSREFLDLACSATLRDAVRPYVALQYVYHIDPAFLGKFALQAGLEVAPAVNEWLRPYAAYDIRLAKIGAYAASHSAQIGARFITRNGAGLDLFLSWYSGYSEHGEYYDIRWSRWGPGFTVTF